MARAMFFSFALVVGPGPPAMARAMFFSFALVVGPRPPAMARAMFFSVELVVVPGCRRQVTGIERFRCNYWCGFDFAQARLLYNGYTPADVCYYGSSNFGLENIKDDR